MVKPLIKIRWDKGEPVIELRPVSDPIAWLSVLEYADLHEYIDDKRRNELFKLLYEFTPDRFKIRKLRHKAYLLRLVTHYRRYFLKDQVENPDWYEEQRKINPDEYLGFGWGKEI